MSVITPGKWNLDASHSEVGFSVRHAGISKTRGKFDVVDGEANITEDFVSSTVSATADAASINTNSPDRDGHLKSADFFDVEQFPQLSFKLTEIQDWDGEEEFKMVGELTIRDITKQVVFDAEFAKAE